MKRVFVVAVLMVAFFAHTSWAQSPQTMSYQGVLNDGSGQPVADGSYSLAFAIYTTGGSQLWTETHGSVTTSNGVFSVILGSQGTPLNLAFDEAYELGIAVNGGSEMTPRIPLASAPYSLNTRAISQASGVTTIGNAARVVDNSGLTVEESGSTGRTLALTSPRVSAAGGVVANSVNGLVMSVTAAGPLQFHTNSTKRVEIKANGQVDFDVAEGLTIAGEDPFPTTGRDTRFIRVVDVNDTGGKPDGDLVIEGYTTSDNGRTPLMTISGRDGRIGFGTYNPTETFGGDVRMRLKGAGHIFVENNYGLFSTNSAGTGWGAGIDTETDDSLIFYTGGISQPDFYIATNSRVGIGTTDPKHGVDVRIDGHVAVKSNYGFFATNTAGNLIAGIDANAGDLDLWANAAARAKVTNSGVSTISSIRWKTNIRPIGSALSLVQKLQGVRYNWKEDGREDIGLIAEEVGKIIPEVVAYEENGVDAQGLRYGHLTAVLVEAVKEQQAQIEKQNALIDKQQAALEYLMSRIAALEKDGDPATVKRTSTNSME